MKAHRISVALVTLIVAAESTAYAQQTAEEVYQAALYQEEVQGNLEGAIDAYERILADFRNNRSVAAKAQLHIGLCYEKLGLTEAQQAYRRVIADYPDHTDEVAVARERLNSLERELAELNRKPTFRKIEIASEPQNGVMSPDGDKLAFTSGDAVWVVPLQGNVSADIAGEPVRIADVPGAWNFMNLLAWSADGEWIAVNGGGLNGDEVYLVPAAGGEPRMIRLSVRGVGLLLQSPEPVAGRRVPGLLGSGVGHTRRGGRLFEAQGLRDPHAWRRAPTALVRPGHVSRLFAGRRAHRIRDVS